jgi:acetyl esterase
VPNPLERLIIRLLPRLPERWVARMAGEPVVIRGRRLDAWAQLLANQAARQPPLYEMTPTEARAASDAAVRLAAGPARPIARVEHRSIPGPGASLPVRVYRPPELAGPRPLLLYFHQGGCVIGNPDWCETFCTVLAEGARCPVVSVDYRLGPEHRFPSAQEDAVAAYRWALAHADEVGGDPERLAVGGDSAGGGLAAHITHEMKRSGERQPVFQLLIYPWLHAYADNAAYRDFAHSYPVTPDLMRWFVGHYLNDDTEREDPRISPLLEKDFSGLAPALIATAGFDPLCDEGEAYADALAKAGVDVTYRCYESLCHSFTSLGGAVPAAAAAQRELARDLDRALSR